jgi:hypothetical protein
MASPRLTDFARRRKSCTPAGEKELPPEEKPQPRRALRIIGAILAGTVILAVVWRGQPLRPEYREASYSELTRAPRGDAGEELARDLVERQPRPLDLERLAVPVRRVA